MSQKRKLATYAVIACALTLVAWAASGRGRRHGDTLASSDPPIDTGLTPPRVKVPKARPRVEVVFALDTTGSMGGLIDGAKRKIWSIARFIASGQPTPEVRIGLVAYRDRGDVYVTRFYDLSDDLDTVYQQLSSFEAAGGGDRPEHVSKGLYDAVYRTSWTADQSTLKLVYLVGDAPPHTDYQDGYDYNAIARHARQVGIRINTIRCGNDAETELVWNEIARASAGEYASIEQSGGVRMVATPYDDKLAELNAKLAKTAIGYGAARAEVARKVSSAVAAPAPMAAERAGFYALAGGAVGGRGDLVVDSEEGGAHDRGLLAGAVGSLAVVNVEKLPAEALPPELAKLDGPARRAFVEQKRHERERLAREISVVSRDRGEFLKKAKPDASGFDGKVEAAIKKQARTIGLAF
jgi:Mg-chelatase subunit ChlD